MDQRLIDKGERLLHLFRRGATLMHGCHSLTGAGRRAPPVGVPEACAKPMQRADPRYPGLAGCPERRDYS
ncbi:MAG: hypothetical protein OEZ03_03355 [Alphaproteobacteria bacterium]|nr:hypothetical protein [Alphaproteobacteria bacterium]